LVQLRNFCQCQALCVEIGYCITLQKKISVTGNLRLPAST
jgi:hypothetical protein